VEGFGAAGGAGGERDVRAGMLRASAKKAMSEALARPSVGGVVREIFSAPSWMPVMALRRAPG